MNLKEEFLKIKTYKEYDVQRKKFKDLDYKDKEVRDHLLSLFSKLEKSGREGGIIVEAYKYPPQKRKK